MAQPSRDSALLQAVIMLAAALVLAPVVRGATLEFNHLLGRVWPFSLGHCVSRNARGCDTTLRVDVVEIPAHASTGATR